MTKLSYINDKDSCRDAYVLLELNPVMFKDSAHPIMDDEPIFLLSFDVFCISLAFISFGNS